MLLQIGVVDDHQLFLKSLALLINGFPGCNVSVEALSGEALLEQLSLMHSLPDILLIDVSMPGMGGIKLAQVITEKYPHIRISALSTKDDDITIIKMIRAGCCAYLLKDIHPDELRRALGEINHLGYYNGDAYNINCRRSSLIQDSIVISEREKVFLQLAATDLTYKQIASKMFLAERTIDGYRETLFGKLNVQSRVGMVLEGIRREIILLNP